MKARVLLNFTPTLDNGPSYNCLITLRYIKTDILCKKSYCQRMLSVEKKCLLIGSLDGRHGPGFQEESHLKFLLADHFSFLAIDRKSDRRKIQ